MRRDKKSLLHRVCTLALLTTILIGCEKGDDYRRISESRTIFAYLAMDNSLNGDGYRNIDLMVKGATRANIGTGTIIVFHDRQRGVPQLLKIYAGPNGQGVIEVVKEYPDDPTTIDGLTLRRAINDMIWEAPARSYGMIMGSHASGWLPADSWWISGYKGAAIDDKTSSDVVLEDNGQYMELSDFAEALPEGLFDFIIFDECYMAGIEVLWALRAKTNYIVASSAEILSEGLPYDKIISPIFAKEPRLGAGGVCDEYFRSTKSCTISLIDCSQLNNEFADIVSNIIGASTIELATLSPDPELNNIQYYDRYTRKVVFDIDGYVKALSTGNDNSQQQLVKLTERLKQIVPYKLMTNEVIYIPKDHDKYSGITCYIPFKGYETLTQKYKETEWYKRVYK